MPCLLRALFAVSCAVATLSGPMAASAADAKQDPAKRPNILWITSEDNHTFLGCYGYPDANTPRLDQLASEGILYENAFANAPVCAPARCTIITGVYPPSMGTQHMRSKNKAPADRIQFFTKHLRDAGYYCTNNSKTDYNLSPYQKDAWDEMTRGDHTKRAKGQPFFAVYNFTTSHESSLHRGLDKSLSDADVIVPPYHPDTPEIRANWAMYHQVISRMDKQVGGVLDKLEKEGVADDTIVFYYGDHGGILPRSKRFLFDTGVQVPMIVRFGKNFAHLAPSKAGSKTDRLVSFVDLAPTVLSLAGVDVPGYMQGEAFLGKQAAEPRDHVYCFRGRMDERYDFSRAVRDERFKYIRNYNPHRIYGQHLQYLWKMPATQSWEEQYLAGKCNPAQSAFWQPKPAEELYDTQADRWEVNNLADDPKYADTLARLRAANRAHMLKIRDSGFLPEAMMNEQADDGTIYDLVRNEKKYPLARLIDLADLATSRDKRHVSQLIEATDDPLAVVRYWGATGCLVLGKDAAPAKAALVDLLEDDSPDVRITAAETLVHLDEAEQALPVLAEALNEDQWAALHAANALESLGTTAKPVLGAMRKAQKHSGNYVRRAAEHGVRVISGEVKQ